MGLPAEAVEEAVKCMGYILLVISDLQSALDLQGTHTDCRSGKSGHCPVFQMSWMGIVKRGLPVEAAEGDVLHMAEIFLVI